MGSEYRQLHIFFFPFLAHGHMIPTIDMAKLFAARGVKATIVTTPLNAAMISKAIRTAKINIETIKLPCSEAGLPEGCEHVDLITSPDMVPTFFSATMMLQEPLEQLLLQHQPDCVVADMFFPWATDSAAKFGIPRFVFHGIGFFSLCASECTRLYQPHKNVSSDTESFVIPHLPGEVKMTRKQMPDIGMKNEDTDQMSRLIIASKESEVRSYGVVVNSFYELEQVYADHYRKVLGRKAWHIGPVSLCNKNNEEKAERGNEASISEHQYCLKWLDKKKPNSVVFLCFGSIVNFHESQLREIAMGLEASGQQFIWVARKGKKDDEEEDREKWLPEGFEKRMEGKGIIVRGWAPQVLILEHEAIGAFVSHCGWNSTLEAVSAGVPMVAWPVFAEQFYNEKLVTEILKIGVPVGVKKWVRLAQDCDTIGREAVERAVKRIMGGEEAEELRNRAKMLAQKARRTVEKGGSSYSDLNALIEELSSRCR